MRHITPTIVGLCLLFGLARASSSKSLNTSSSVSFQDNQSHSRGSVVTSTTDSQSLLVSPTTSEKDTSTTRSQFPSVAPILTTDTTASPNPPSTLKVATFLTTSYTTTQSRNGKQPMPSYTTVCEPCRLFGGSVKIFKWAEPKEEKNSSLTYKSTYVNSNNYTFTSPSIYVEFQSLYATDSCSSTVGYALGSTTLVFGQHDLSTGKAWFTGTIAPSYNVPFFVDSNPQVAALQVPTFTLADFNEPLNCTQYTTTMSWYGTNYASTQDSPTDYIATAVEYTYNPCSPAISVPTELYKLEPEWLTCLPGVNALCDPPYTLTPASGLVEFTTGSPSAQTRTPQKQIVPAIPTATPSPTLGPGPLQTANTDPSEYTTSTINSPAAESPSGGGSDPTAKPASDTAPPTASESSLDSPSSTIPVPFTTIIVSPVAQPTPYDTSSEGVSSSKDRIPQQNEASPTVIIIGSSTLTAISSSMWVYESRTLSPGGAFTVSGTVYTISHPSPTPITQPAPAVVKIGSSTISLNPDGFFVYGSQTLTPGGSITVSGSVYSIPSTKLPSANPEVVTVGSSIMTANLAGDYVYGSQTLMPGQSITVSGSVYSIPSPAPASLVSTYPTVITIGSSIITANPAGDFVYDTQTLVPGSSITVSGTVYSDRISSPASSTETTSTNNGIGGAILSVGGFASSSDPPAAINNNTGPPGAAVATGGSDRKGANLPWVIAHLWVPVLGILIQ